MLCTRVEGAIRNHGLLSEGQPVVVGVSGGVDSVVLLHVLHALSARHGWRLTVLHVDHGLRRASAADAAFAAATGWRLGLPVVRYRVPVKPLADRFGVSVEMAARTVRLRAARAVCRKLGTHAVAAWGHHADDQAETVLLRVARGTGLEGLAGMAPRDEVHGVTIIRPLLDLRREDIRAFAVAHGLVWREDESNREGGPLRNRVRHRVLPMLERELNPEIRTALVRLAAVAGAEREVLDERTGERLAACRGGPRSRTLDLAGLSGLAAGDRRRVLRAWLVEQGVPPGAMGFATLRRVEDLAIAGQPGQVVVPGGMRVKAGRAVLSVRAPDKAGPLPPVDLVPPGTVELPAWGVSVSMAWSRGYQVRPARIGVWPAVADLNAEAVRGKRVQLRAWRPGDRYRPIGLADSVKLQDLFVNQGVARERRGRIPVILVGDRIAWVAGGRIAHALRLRNVDAPSVRITIDHLETGAEAAAGSEETLGSAPDAW